MESYYNTKNKIKEIYEKKAEDARIRSKCLWHEEGEKSSKFFLSLEKRRGIQGQIRKPIVNNQEITHQNMIQNELLFFYEILFRNTSAKFSERSFCSQGDLNEIELLKALMSMQNNKSSGSDGLTKEFSEKF